MNEKEGGEEIYVMCRRGVDSVTATHLLLEGGVRAVNVEGGISAWSRRVDKDVPIY